MRGWRRLFGRRSAHYGAEPRMPHDRAYQETSELLTAILTGIPRLQRLDGRHHLLEEIGGRLGKDTPEHNVARDHLRAIVDTARRTSMLKSLRDGLLRIDEDDFDTAWFNLAVTVLTVPGSLRTEHMLSLIRELRSYQPEFGGRAVSVYASERRDSGRPLDTGPLPLVLLRLYDAQVDGADASGSRADLLRFLRLLSEEPVPDGQSDGLARLLAHILDGRGAMMRKRAQSEATPRSTDAERQVIVQIRVEEEDAPGDLPYTKRHYSLRGFYYERIGDARPAFRGARSLPGLFTGDELESRGRDFLAAWREQAEAGRGVNKRVEFLLPHSLLGYPAELWPGGSTGIPLSHSCQVVVRSLPRYQDSSIHGEWIRRWEALDRGFLPGDALERIGWMGPCATVEGADVDENSTAMRWKWPTGKYPPLRLTDPAEVEGWLRENAELACLGLGTPYDDHDPLIRESVCEALLEDGIPVMVWRRDRGDPGLLMDALRDNDPPALLADLPHSVLQARRVDRRDPLSLSNHITLLWDDPTSVHGDQDHQMSGTREAGEGAA